MSLIIEQIVEATIDNIIQSQNQNEINHIQECFECDNFDNLSEFYMENFKKNYSLYENSLMYEANVTNIKNHKKNKQNKKNKRTSNPRIKKLANARLKYKKSLNNSTISNIHKGLSNFAKKKLANHSKTRTVAKYADRSLRAVVGGTVGGLRRGKQAINRTFRQRGKDRTNPVARTIQKVFTIPSIDTMKSDQKDLAKKFVANNTNTPKSRRNPRVLEKQIGGKKYTAAQQNLKDLTDLEHKRKNAYGVQRKSVFPV